MTQFDVVVVGGGAMGSAAAWQLARRGVQVALLEQHEAGHANGASHGASRIFRLSYPDPVHIGLAREARRLWRELEDVTGESLLTITGGVEHGGHPFLQDLAAGLTAAGIHTAGSRRPRGANGGPASGSTPGRCSIRTAGACTPTGPSPPCRPRPRRMARSCGTRRR